MNEQPPDQPNPEPNNEQPAPSSMLPQFPQELQRKFIAQAQLENGSVVNMQVVAIDHLSALTKIIAILSDCPLRVAAMNFQDQGSPTGILSASGVPIHHGPGPRNRLR